MKETITPIMGIDTHYIVDINFNSLNSSCVFPILNESVRYVKIGYE